MDSTAEKAQSNDKIGTAEESNDDISEVDEDEDDVDNTNDNAEDNMADNTEDNMADNEDNKMATNHNVEITPNHTLIYSSIASSKDGLEENEPTKESDISLSNRHIWIFTTAGLPWRTGTAVNPLLRALALCKSHSNVTLVVPWLPNEEQRIKLYGVTNQFATQNDQEEWIRQYCRTRCDSPDEEKTLRIKFWLGSYNQAFGSIFPAEDLCTLVPQSEADVAILEEPEHLTWFRGIDEQTAQGDVLGWAHKFRHVVGILHTNYAAYIKQYGVGTSFVTARALNALSALVIKSYCHVVIRLSATLPLLVDPKMDVVCNVHGVSGVFLEKGDETQHKKEDVGEYAPVYFVGKIIWAKGFDKLLELQERFRTLTGEHFPIDVYGGGEDEKAVKLAFLGRRGSGKGVRSGSGLGGKESKEKAAAAVLSNPGSLREQLSESNSRDNEKEASPSSPSEAASPQESDNAKFDFQPLPAVDVLGQLTEKMVQSGAETAEASMKLVEAVIENGLGVIAGANNDTEKKKQNSDEKEDDGEAKDIKPPPSSKHKPHKTLSFLPARSRFKWRKEPIPARFLGVVDHAEVRNIPQQQIFLNMSTTEVLCTTSAEALAMGKFVILPNHPSNTFFLDFPNCLPYSTLDECVEKLKYALDNEPKPLSEENRRALSWDGATERLYQASVITKKQAQDRARTGFAKEQLKAARTHVDMAKRSHFVSNLFSGKSFKKLSSGASNVSQDTSSSSSSSSDSD